MAKFNVEHVADDNYIPLLHTDGVLTLLVKMYDELMRVKGLVSAAAFPGASDGSLTKTYDGSDETVEVRWYFRRCARLI